MSMGLAYISYCNSIGLDWNPNKVDFFGIKLRYRTSIRKLVTDHFAKRNFSDKEKKMLWLIVKWEKLNMIFFILLPIISILLFITFRKTTG